MAVKLQYPDLDLHPRKNCRVFKLHREKARKRCDFEAESYNWQRKNDFGIWVNNLKYKRRTANLAAFEVKFEGNIGCL